MKLFIHEILPPTVTRAIFIDTDAFFITDPALLWQFFDDLDPDTAISMPTHPDQSAVQWHHANRICSCIMLLNLEKLRALRLMDSSLYRDDVSGAHPPPLAPPAFEAMYGPPGADGHYQDVKLGDQGYWWAIVAHRPEIFQHLSYEWEVSSCLLDMYRMSLGDDGASEKDEAGRQIHTIGTPHEGEVILPKMLHLYVQSYVCMHRDTDIPVATALTGLHGITNGKVRIPLQKFRACFSLLYLRRLGRSRKQSHQAVVCRRHIPRRVQVAMVEPQHPRLDQRNFRDGNCTRHTVRRRDLRPARLIIYNICTKSIPLYSVARLVRSSWE